MGSACIELTNYVFSIFNKANRNSRARLSIVNDCKPRLGDKSFNVANYFGPIGRESVDKVRRRLDKENEFLKLCLSRENARRS